MTRGWRRSFAVPAQIRLALATDCVECRLREGSQLKVGFDMLLAGLAQHGQRPGFAFHQFYPDDERVFDAMEQRGRRASLHVAVAGQNDQQYLADTRQPPTVADFPNAME